MPPFFFDPSFFAPFSDAAEDPVSAPNATRPKRSRASLVDFRIASSSGKPSVSRAESSERLVKKRLCFLLSSQASALHMLAGSRYCQVISMVVAQL